MFSFKLLPTNSVVRMAFAVAMALAFSLSSNRAHAELKLCNQTSYVLYAAVGIQQSAQIVTRGWTRVVPGDCGTTVEEPLAASGYFIYARSAPNTLPDERSWGGQNRYCIRDGNFWLQMPANAGACKPDGAMLAPFAPVATGGAKSWTMTLTESAALASPVDARDAGLRRLLSSLGYMNPADRDPKHLGDALEKFRARAHLAANTNSADLFAALETQARGTDKPSGYAICNDSSSEIWAALAFWSGQEFVSRGWWDIASGSCTQAIADGLGRDAVYLYASKHGNNKLVSGPDNFCISDSAFDIHGRDRCEAHGYSVTGFAATNTKGSTGFVAHISDSGLAQGQAPTPK